MEQQDNGDSDCVVFVKASTLEEEHFDSNIIIMMKKLPLKKSQDHFLRPVQVVNWMFSPRTLLFQNALVAYLQIRVE